MDDDQRGFLQLLASTPRLTFFALILGCVILCVLDSRKKWEDQVEAKGAMEVLFWGSAYLIGALITGYVAIFPFLIGWVILAKLFS